MLIESRNGPRTAPGETLHPGVEPIMHSLGVLEDVKRAGFLRHRGVWYESGGQRRFVPYGADDDGQWFGYQAERRTLHGILESRAIAVGAALKRNKRPSRVLYDNGRVMGVAVGSKEIGARWTLDGTGRKSWLARSLDLGLRRYSPFLGVTFGWFCGWEDQDDGQPRFEITSDGWDWFAPLGGNKTAWVKLRVEDSPFQRARGSNQTWHLRPKCAAPGYFLLGRFCCRFGPCFVSWSLKGVDEWHSCRASHGGLPQTKVG